LDKESYFISLISADAKKFIGDDGVLADGWIYSQDAFFEDTHFKTSWMSLYQIARKSLLVNLSDSYAMNGTPKYALLTISIPKNYKKQQLEELSRGFLDTAREHNVKIIGGDTISSNKLTITLTIISKPNKKTLHRNGMKLGDLVAFSGTLGSSKRDLESLLSGREINRDSKMFAPFIRPRFIKELARYINSAMDVSDGLSTDLSRMGRINRLGFRFFRRFDKNTHCSGEEYELLFSFSQKNLDAVKNIAKKHRVKLNIFAKTIRGAYKNRCKSHHF